MLTAVGNQGKWIVDVSAFSSHIEKKKRLSEERKTTSKPSQKFPSFHEVLGPILTVCQCFGYLPVCGIFEKQCTKLYFKWSSFRAIYVVFILSLGTFEVLLMCYKAVLDGLSIATIEVLMFYGFSVLRVYAFLYLATKWKKIMVYWHRKERPFLHEPYEMSGISLSRRLQLIGIVFFIFYLIEHLLFIGMEMHVNSFQLTHCNETKITFLNNYMRMERPHLLLVLPYRWWIFPFFQWTISCFAFGWNFVDYFIVVISVGLSTRFNQLNGRLRHTYRSQRDTRFWKEIRTQYCNLVDLLRYIDQKIALLMLLSLFQTLFLIATKLFEAIGPSNRVFAVQSAYFYFYLFFLFFRASVLLYSCSNVHQMAIRPIVHIRGTPTKFWSIDLKRLSDMIQSETIALTGYEFFYITRQLILSMVGAIVTFELVLLDRGSRGDEESRWCEYFEWMRNESLKAGEA